MGKAKLCSTCGTERPMPGMAVCEYCAPHEEVIVREPQRVLSAEELEEM